MKKEYRVKKSKDIEDILHQKKYTSNSYFIIYVKEQCETCHFRYAMSVGKKIGNAVVRNRIKRQIRSIVDNEIIKNGIDFFIIARPKVMQLSFEDLKKQLIFLLQKQKLLVKGEKND